VFKRAILVSLAGEQRIRALIVVVLAAVVVGCASYREIILHNLDQRAAAYVGQPLDKVVAEWGVPSFVAKLQDGGALVIYETPRVGQIPVTTISMGAAASNTPPQQRVTSWIEVVSFTFDPSMKVARYTVGVR
jgi:hypothetical protein